MLEIKFKGEKKWFVVDFSKISFFLEHVGTIVLLKNEQR